MSFKSASMLKYRRVLWAGVGGCRANKGKIINLRSSNRRLPERLFAAWSEWFSWCLRRVDPFAHRQITDDLTE